MNLRNLLPLRSFDKLRTGQSNGHVRASEITASAYATLGHGGLRNPRTGMGGSADKTDGAYFLPTRLNSRQELETLYVESWAARKYVDIPVDDMTIRWRQWQDDAEEMMEAERKHQSKAKIAAAVKAGRLYGSGLLLMITAESTLDTPLRPEAIRPGDLLALQVVDRYNAVVMERERDLYSPMYGQPSVYQVYGQYGDSLRIHASRVIRFDGIASLSMTGHTVYDRDWGASALIPMIQMILQDAGIFSNAAHLTYEASIPVIGIERFREALAQSPDADPEDIHPNMLGQEINKMKSIYRTIFTDKSDTFNRVAVNFGGLPQLIDRSEARLAAAADIPRTRWAGASPVGLTATGESDMANYALLVAERQQEIEPILAPLDLVLARDAGMNVMDMENLPEYEWVSLQDVSDSDSVTISKTRVETITSALNAGLMDEQEARDILRTDVMFQDLEEELPEIEVVEAMPPMIPPMEEGQAEETNMP